MKIVDMFYPTTLDKIKNIEDEGIDVIVGLDDGYEPKYVIDIGTPMFIRAMIHKFGDGWYGAGCPNLIVKSLKYDIILQAIKEFAKNDAYWLKIYGVWPLSFHSSVPTKHETKIKQIHYSQEIEFVCDGKVEISVEMDNGAIYRVDVVDPRHYEKTMSQTGISFIMPAPADIIVNPFTRDNISAAVEAYHISEGNWLRFGELARKKLVRFELENDCLTLAF
jgi:hypothetical protein